MLKFNHRTAWEGDDCDVIVGNISCPNLYPSNRRITSINIPGLGVEPHYKSFSAKALSLNVIFFHDELHLVLNHLDKIHQHLKHEQQN